MTDTAWQRRYANILQDIAAQVYALSKKAANDVQPNTDAVVLGRNPDGTINVSDGAGGCVIVMQPTNLATGQTAQVPKQPIPNTTGPPITKLVPPGSTPPPPSGGTDGTVPGNGTPPTFSEPKPTPPGPTIGAGDPGPGDILEFAIWGGSGVWIGTRRMSDPTKHDFGVPTTDSYDKVFENYSSAFAPPYVMAFSNNGGFAMLLSSGTVLHADPASRIVTAWTGPFHDGLGGPAEAIARTNGEMVIYCWDSGESGIHAVRVDLNTQTVIADEAYDLTAFLFEADPTVWLIEYTASDGWRGAGRNIDTGAYVLQTGWLVTSDFSGLGKLGFDNAGTFYLTKFMPSLDYHDGFVLATVQQLIDGVHVTSSVEYPLPYLIAGPWYYKGQIWYVWADSSTSAPRLSGFTIGSSDPPRIYRKMDVGAYFTGVRAANGYDHIGVAWQNPPSATPSDNYLIDGLEMSLVLQHGGFGDYFTLKVSSGDWYMTADSGGRPDGAYRHLTTDTTSWSFDTDNTDHDGNLLTPGVDSMIVRFYVDSNDPPAIHWVKGVKGTPGAMPDLPGGGPYIDIGSVSLMYSAHYPGEVAEGAITQSLVYVSFSAEDVNLYLWESDPNKAFPQVNLTTGQTTAGGSGSPPPYTPPIPVLLPVDPGNSN
jgi:hypothetical protein